jgi:RNA polymerase sigma-70 factor (ECF subfamily)
MTDVGLVQRAKDGDRDAFDALMSSWLDRLFRIAYLCLRDADSAQDAVQEALVDCWRELPRLREPHRFDAWLRRITMRAITDEARRRRRMSGNVVALRMEPAQPDRSQALADEDEIARVFERLSIDHRTVVVLHHYLGLTVPEIAKALGVPAGTAKSRLHYAAVTLRAALEADARTTSAAEAMA